MGLMQGASIRIVTPSSRLSMPEISIGLFPDVGGSWFLARLPGKLGLFLGLTGAQVNARDALDLNLADRCLGDDQQAALLSGLEQLNWQEQPALQLNSLLKALEHEARAQLPAAQWLPRRAQLDSLLDVADLPAAWRAISQLQNDQDPLLARAGRTLSEGCPPTAPCAMPMGATSMACSTRTRPMPACPAWGTCCGSSRVIAIPQSICTTF